MKRALIANDLYLGQVKKKEKHVSRPRPLHFLALPLFLLLFFMSNDLRAKTNRRHL